MDSEKIKRRLYAIKHFLRVDTAILVIWLGSQAIQLYLFYKLGPAGNPNNEITTVEIVYKYFLPIASALSGFAANIMLLRCDSRGLWLCYIRIALACLSWIAWIVDLARSTDLVVATTLPMVILALFCFAYYIILGKASQVYVLLTAMHSELRLASRRG